jgi:hypothetical protein
MRFIRRARRPSHPSVLSWQVEWVSCARCPATCCVTLRGWTSGTTWRPPPRVSAQQRTFAPAEKEVSTLATSSVHFVPRSCVETIATTTVCTHACTTRCIPSRFKNLRPSCSSIPASSPSSLSRPSLQVLLFVVALLWVRARHAHSVLTLTSCIVLVTGSSLTLTFIVLVQRASFL